MRANRYILGIFFLISLSGFSQKNYWTISGIVQDDKHVSVPFARVFVNNTSVGTTTDEMGSFQLNISDKVTQAELVISFVGFKTIKRKINASDEIQVFRIRLEQLNKLNDVEFTATNSEDSQTKWKLFENALLGNSEFTADCKILNPKVVRLDYNQDKKLVAAAKEPILIRNDALGFKIWFYMDKFESDGTSAYYSGLKFFEKLDAAGLPEKSKWDKNQKGLFSDSFRNFLMALSLNKLTENNFAVYKIAVPGDKPYKQETIADDVKAGTLIPCEAPQIYAYDKDTDSFMIQSEHPLLVFIKKDSALTDYPFQYSEMVLPKGYAKFNENGWLNRPNDIVLKNYWGFKGFSNLLPDDYNIDAPIKQPEEFRNRNSGNWYSIGKKN